MQHNKYLSTIQKADYFKEKGTLRNMSGAFFLSHRKRHEYTFPTCIHTVSDTLFVNIIFLIACNQLFANKDKRLQIRKQHAS